MIYTIPLPWPPRALHPNARTHWAARAKAAAKARADARHLAQAVGARALGWDGAAVRLTFCPPDRRVRDLDGVLSSCKAGCDGIADATGVDDSRWSLALAWGPVVRGGAVIVDLCRPGDSP